MNRRGFLGRFLAASAALVAANKASPAAVQAVAPPKRLAPPPTTAITANTSRFSAALRSASKEVEGLLKDCRAQSIEVSHNVGELTRVHVTYVHSPKAKRTPLDADVEAIVGGGKGHIVSAEVRTCEDVSVFELGAFHYRPKVMRSEVTIEWVVR